MSQLPRRLRIRLQEQLRKESEARMNRWLFIAFMALSAAEVAVRYFGVR